MEWSSVFSEKPHVTCTDFENDLKPTKIQREGAMENVTYAVFFRSTSTVKAIESEG